MLVATYLFLPKESYINVIVLLPEIAIELIAIIAILLGTRFALLVIASSQFNKENYGVLGD